jgi:hypothetical protein
MNDKTALFAVQVASTDFTREAHLDCSSSAPTIRFSFLKGEREVSSGIQFNRVAALRKRGELCVSAWHIEEAYDTLVEVKNSEWLLEIQRDVPEHFLGDWKVRHFMIYLDSVGCFEFLAEEWRALPEKDEGVFASKKGIL